MELFVLILSCALLGCNALAYVPAVPRLRRDVSELPLPVETKYLAPQELQKISAEVLTEESTLSKQPLPAKTKYLPPQQLQKISAEALTEEFTQNEVTQEDLNGENLSKFPPEIESNESAVFGKNGYEYETPTFRRNRRDVSHLHLNYLPPLPPHHHRHQHLQQPASKYLAPVSSERSQQFEPSTHYLPPVLPKDVEIPAASPIPSNEYLPPVSVKDAEEISTEAAPLPSNEYLPPAKQEEAESSSSEATVVEPEPTTTVAATKTPEVATLSPAGEDHEDETTIAPVVEETVVFAEDGYHYKRPDVIPAELFSITSETPVETTPITDLAEYLPPLEEGVVEAEGPSDGESAVLDEDGYHYRIIKRRF